MRAMTAVLGSVLFLAAAAHAAPQAVELMVWLSDPGKPVQPSAPAGTTAKPEIEADQALSIEELDGPVRAEQEQILADLIANTPDQQADEKSEYYARLGELHAKQHRQWRRKSAELLIRGDQAKDVKLEEEAAQAAEKAKQYLKKAVKTYRALTENEAFRNYMHLDKALFQYGYTLQSNQLMSEARAVYDKLLKSYPSSKYVPEAHLVFGDYFFETGMLADAEARYKMVLKFPKSRSYWYAMYKQGWIQLGLQRYQEALEMFFQVTQATKNDQKQERLNRASSRDFVRAFAEIGKPDKAYPAFQRVDATHALEMLHDLAGLYLDQGKSDQARYVYQQLIQTTPGDPNACGWQYHLARLTASSARKPVVVEVCAPDVAALKEWARASGVSVGKRP